MYCIYFEVQGKRKINQPWGRSCYQCYTVSTSNSWTLLPSASDAPNIVYFVRGGEDIMAARTSRRVLTREKWDNTVFKCVRIKHKSNKGLKGYIHECIKAKKLVSIPLCAILLYTRSLLCIPLHPHNTPPLYMISSPASSGTRASLSVSCRSASALPIPHRAQTCPWSKASPTELCHSRGWCSTPVVKKVKKGRNEDTRWSMKPNNKSRLCSLT
jgi:hypothetical protein